MANSWRYALAALLLASTPVVAVGAPAEGGSAASNLTQEAMALRDPFKKPSTVGMAEAVPKTELELVPVHSFKVVAIMTGPGPTKAMLLGPDGKSYFIKTQDKIGLKKGYVKKITSDVVEVEERVVNVLGEEEVSSVELRLDEDTTFKATSQGTATPPPQAY